SPSLRGWRRLFHAPQLEGVRIPQPGKRFQLRGATLAGPGHPDPAPIRIRMDPQRPGAGSGNPAVLLAAFLERHVIARLRSFRTVTDTIGIRDLHDELACVGIDAELRANWQAI